MVSKAPPGRLDTHRLMAWSSAYTQLQLELSRAPHMSAWGEPFQAFSSDNVCYSWLSVQTPPHHGAFLRLNFHWIFLCKWKDMTSGSLKIHVSWVAAALNVLALSDMISSGNPLRATNLLRHRMNTWVVRLGVSSICMAVVLPQVNKQRYTLLTWISLPETVFVDVSRFSPCAINLARKKTFAVGWRNAAHWLVDLLGVDLIWRHLLRDKFWVRWKTSNKAKICCSKSTSAQLLATTFFNLQKMHLWRAKLIAQGEKRETST